MLARTVYAGQGRPSRARANTARSYGTANSAIRPSRRAAPTALMLP